MPRRNFRYLYKDEIIPSATELKGISELYDLYAVKAADKSYPTGFYITGSSLDSGTVTVGTTLSITINSVGYHIERTFVSKLIHGTSLSADFSVIYSPLSTTVTPINSGELTNQSLGNICDVSPTATVSSNFIVTIETAEEGILYQKTITII